MYGNYSKGNKLEQVMNLIKGFTCASNITAIKRKNLKTFDLRLLT
jgi:hypothetical protein